MNIIINGGTSGIGKETALLFSREKKNRIIVTGRNRNALSALEKEAVHNNIIALELDLTVIGKSRDRIEKCISENLNIVDILINNAGYLKSELFKYFQEQEARTIFETNLFGPATLIRITEPFMKNGSHIVNISSMGGFQGSSKYKGLSYYSASKAALACLTECLAEEFSEKNIKVNCLALGSVQTEMLEKAFPDYKAPVNAAQMAELITEFALKGSQFYNGKIIPVALSNP